MAKEKSFFAFLFKKDSPSERDAKSDGKGVNELSSRNNEEISKNLNRAPSLKGNAREQIVIEDNKKERQQKHIEINQPDSTFQKKQNKKAKRYSRKRYIELNDQRVDANSQIKDRLRKASPKKNLRIKSNEQKAILKFIQNLDPEVQRQIANNLREKTKTRNAETQEKLRQRRVEFSNNKQREKPDLYEKIEQKRGIQSTGRLAVLKTAKKIAEKARLAVKNFRAKIIAGKARQTTNQEKQKRRTQRQFSNIQIKQRQNKER